MLLTKTFAGTATASHVMTSPATPILITEVDTLTNSAGTTRPGSLITVLRPQDITGQAAGGLRYITNKMGKVLLMMGTFEHLQPT